MVGPLAGECDPPPPLVLNCRDFHTAVLHGGSGTLAGEREGGRVPMPPNSDAGTHTVLLYIYTYFVEIYILYTILYLLTWM
jgi:hypothetical protein